MAENAEYVKMKYIFSSAFKMLDEQRKLLSVKHLY